MLIPKSKIPRVAIAGLALGGVAAGCGDDISVNGLAADICSTFARCNADAFSNYYGSQAECRAEFREELEDVRATESAACANAYFALISCYSDAHSPTCQADQDLIEAQCESDYNAYYAACD